MDKKIIGLTGPTGAGKSTAASLLRALGCGVVDCDVITHDMLKLPACVKNLTEAFGASILDSNGQVDRAALAKIAFANSESAQRLNNATHPAIMDEMDRQISELAKTEVSAVVVDAALLFESGADTHCDTTIAVTAPINLRLERIIKRDGITKVQAASRISAQHENEYYSNRAKYVVNGALEVSHMEKSINEVFEKIVEK